MGIRFSNYIEPLEVDEKMLKSGEKTRPRENEDHLNVVQLVKIIIALLFVDVVHTHHYQPVMLKRARRPLRPR